MSRQIVYILGAGLTKALELLPKRVPVMNDFVSLLADRIDQNDSIRVHLAHIEICQLFEHRSPEARAAAIEMLVKENDSAAVRESFKQAMKTRPPENIETLIDQAVRSARYRGQNPLTYADASDFQIPELGANIVKWFALGEAHRRFIGAINSYFRWVGWELRLELLRRFIARQVALPDTKHTFITFNYDLSLDYCLQNEAAAGWSPAAGYGIPVKYFMRADRGGSLRSEIEPFPGPEPAGEHVQVLKPHGSFNWLAPFDAESQFEHGPLVVVLGRNLEITYFAGHNVPEARLPDARTLNLALFVYPPAGDKRFDFEFIKETLKAESEALTKADEAYVIGWSLPPTDFSQIAVIRDALRRRIRAIDQVTVVNYGAPAKYFDDVAAVFQIQPGQVRKHNAGFEVYLDSCT